jgi:hypothetical protein
VDGHVRVRGGSGTIDLGTVGETDSMQENDLIIMPVFGIDPCAAVNALAVRFETDYASCICE